MVSSSRRGRTMSSVGAIGSGGNGGAAAAPVSNQRVTPSDGGAAVGSESNKGVEMGGTPDAGSESNSTSINITNEVNCYQNMSSEQSLQIGGGSEMGQMGQGNEMDLEKIMKMLIMMIILKMLEKMMEQMGGGAEGGASMLGGGQ